MKLTDDYAAGSIDAYKNRIDERYRANVSHSLCARFAESATVISLAKQATARSLNPNSTYLCCGKFLISSGLATCFLLNPSHLVNHETRFEHRIDTALGLAVTQWGD
jgi:hypothetical protein